MPIRHVAAVIASGLVLAAVGLAAQNPADWTEWRGPQRNGTLTGVAVPKVWPPTLTNSTSSRSTRWPTAPPTASRAIVGNRLYVKDNDGLTVWSF